MLIKEDRHTGGSPIVEKRGGSPMGERSPQFSPTPEQGVAAAQSSMVALSSYSD
jgi:hypothetical protein